MIITYKTNNQLSTHNPPDHATEHTIANNLQDARQENLEHGSLVGFHIRAIRWRRHVACYTSEVECHVSSAAGKKLLFDRSCKRRRGAKVAAGNGKVPKVEGTIFSTTVRQRLEEDMLDIFIIQVGIFWLQRCVEW